VKERWDFLSWGKEGGAWVCGRPGGKKTAKLVETLTNEDVADTKDADIAVHREPSNVLEKKKGMKGK